MSSKRIKIIDVKYTEANNLIELLVQLETGNQINLAMMGEEFGHLFNINKILTTEEIKFGCEAIKGKEIGWQSIIDENILPEKIEKEISAKDEFLLDSAMHDYPFDRVMGNIYNGNIENLRNKLIEDVNSSLKDYGCKIQIIKKENIVLPQKFHFLGMWRNLGKKMISSETIDDIFNIISGISSKHGLVAERLDDFEDGFFTLRPQV